jgi:hypothetical protein
MAPVHQVAYIQGRRGEKATLTIPSSPTPIDWVSNWFYLKDRTTEFSQELCINYRQRTPRMEEEFVHSD